MAKVTRWAYFFGNGKADGRGEDRELLGGKGAGLAEMTRIGLPVPAGFTITTEACIAFNQRGRRWPSGLDKQVRAMLTKLERCCKKKLGAPRDPLLVSVRSGAARSMPGMMETVLNLGLNDESVEGLAEASGSRRFALDAYRRLIMMFGATAKGIDRGHFDQAFDELKRTRTARRLVRGADETIADTDVDAEELAELVETFKTLYREHTGQSFPQDPFEQLVGAVDAVFDSWTSEKAVTYRRVENMSGLNGTAVNVCQMVFGNMGDDSGTGVCFTRDPSTGEATFYGDLLINAQGEDVVAGIRNTLPLDELKTLMPDVYDQLEAVRAMLEVHYQEMQDLEFTIERGKLYMLQCRVGKRSPQAAFKIAVDQATKPLMTAAQCRRLVRKKYLPQKYATAAVKPIIDRRTAVRRLQASDIERLFYPVLDPQIPPADFERRLLTTGIGAVPGAASGQIVFSAEEAESRARQGAEVILVRKETSPEDVGGMHAAVGILTATGGKTSHAAVVARGWGKCCIVGCQGLSVNDREHTVSVNGRTLYEGDPITLDGGAGSVYDGRFHLVRPQAPPEFSVFMRWCDDLRRLRVRANADTPQDAARAVDLGAEGIGLCRTEHMFFDSTEPQRLTAMREMILAVDEENRRSALDKLLPFQRADFEGIFEAMNGLPVTIRLLDPPLHEFLPAADSAEAIRHLADELNASVRDERAQIALWDEERRTELDGRHVTAQDIAARAEQLHEFNPMLGHRGCRLCITYPEVLEMQVRAIIEAAIACNGRGIKVLPEIMIPLTIDDKELGILTERVRLVADELIKEHKSKVKYLVGTMIETPRAALLAKRMAGAAEFFSFGTNDLTQTTLAVSRDDAGRFLPEYVDQEKSGILPDDPFQSLDVDGVGLLMRMAVDNGRAGRKNIKLGVCGEHGGDPKSVFFCHDVGLDYVSCSPLRVPVARLAAAQAVLNASPTKRRTGTTKMSRRTTGRPGATKKVARKKVAKRTAGKPKRSTASKTSRSAAAARKKAATSRKRSTTARKRTTAKRSTKTAATGKSAKRTTRKKVTRVRPSIRRPLPRAPALV